MVCAYSGRSASKIRVSFPQLEVPYTDTLRYGWAAFIPDFTAVTVHDGPKAPVDFFKSSDPGLH